MKKISIIAGLLSICTVLSAQSMYDAYAFAESGYTGTAYTTALSNAVTSLGGDLGTVPVNPAGSAVAGYSQFSISPGLSISSTSSAFRPGGYDAFGTFSSSSRARFQLPNVGISLRYDNAVPSAMKALVFSFVCSSSNDHNYYSTASALSDKSSKFAEMAAASTGLDPDEIGWDYAYDNSNLNNYWDAIAAYRMGQISSYGTHCQYVGCSEILTRNPSTGQYSHYIPGELNQQVSVSKFGSTNDMLFNFAIDFNHNFFIGFSLGMPIQSYTNVETTKEVAVDPDLFPVEFTYSDGAKVNTFFSNAAYQYTYSAELAGIYAKIGAIGVLDCGLRLGAAVKTPVSYSVSESWRHSGGVAYVNGSSFSGSSKTGEYSYNFRSPFEANFGVSYVFGHMGLLSVDYELTDYKVMRFTDYDTFSDAGFEMTNKAISELSGVSHSLRVGGEFNLPLGLSLRAGYSLTTSPEKCARASDGSLVYYGDYMSTDHYYLGRKSLGDFRYCGDSVHSVSGGLGYRSEHSFFADLAVKCTLRPENEFSPYGNYDNWQYDEATGDYKSVEVFEAPSIVNRNSLFNVILTVGWRF